MSTVVTALRDRWPAFAGLAVAVLTAVALWLRHADASAVVTASALVYLGSAALGLRWSAWPIFGVSFVLISIGFLVPAFDPTLIMIALAVLLIGYGFVRGRGKPLHGLPLQLIAMVILAGLALIAARQDPALSAILVAVGLLVHAGWDVYHHRKDRVVVRSMAEFCMVLDTVLAGLVIWLAFA